MRTQFAIAAVAAAAAAAGMRRRRRARLPAHAVIVSPPRSTLIHGDGAVRSVQSARLTLGAADLDRLWIAPNLENLARTYWRFLSRVTMGLIRVVYTADSRSVVALGRPLTLLRFDVPEYTLERDHGAVRWRIRDGLLVARSGRGCGFLALDVRRLTHDPTAGPGRREELRIEVEVANFYPAIAARLSIPAYEMTQSIVHVLVTHAFLRSLARLDLAHSRIGALAVRDDAGTERPAGRGTTGDALRPRPAGGARPQV